MTQAIKIAPGYFDIDTLRRLWQEALILGFSDTYYQEVKLSCDIVHSHANGNSAVYGVNTGFGKLANTRIAASDLAQLQLNLLRSHAVGVGDPMPANVVSLMLALKAASLARGLSGVRIELVELLLQLHNKNILPVVPQQGSVGASGDLAPLAHLCLPLIGEGEVFVQGQRMSAAQGLKHHGLQPIQLAAKEGLALINGTQASTALALDALFSAERVFEAAVISGALTIDAARGSDGPFDARIHIARGQPGQIECAAAYRSLLTGSEIRGSHLNNDDRVQDPYCLRCQPQVMGACLDSMRHAAQVLAREANAVTDNPLVFARDGVLLSGGNFHAEPVALACDALAVAIAEVGAIAERRIAMLIDGSISRLPPFLSGDAGLNSGFMIAHVTAASLASENKSFAHPASVDSLPTSANQEDHVSMATFAARRLQPMLLNVSRIVAIELMAAAQGIDFLRPLRTAQPLERLYALIRSFSLAVKHDRILSGDIETIHQQVWSGAIAHALDTQLPELHALRLSP